jgi:hypothetical protein
MANQPTHLVRLSMIVTIVSLPDAVGSSLVMKSILIFSLPATGTSSDGRPCINPKGPLDSPMYIHDLGNTNIGITTSLWILYKYRVYLVSQLLCILLRKDFEFTMRVISK